MIRNKSIVLLLLALLPNFAQDVPQPVQPASVGQPGEPEQRQRPGPTEQPEQPNQSGASHERSSTATVEFSSEPRRIQVKPGVPGNRRVSTSVTRNGRATPEMRAFVFNNDPFGGGQRRRPLMIRSSRADVKTMEQLGEDLTVMTRLLEKAVMEHGGGFHPRKAAGIDILTLNAGMPYAGGAMYIDDYGVIFTLSVNMPLKAEPKVEEVEPKEPRRRGAWEQAHSELFGRERRRVTRWQPSAWRQFDQEEVDAFKTTLLETMREARNIRHLKPTDMIAVVVRGTPQAEEREVMLQLEGAGKEGTVLEESSNPESTLVLRIDKGDLDRAVITGKDSGELRRAVRISIY